MSSIRLDSFEPLPHQQLIFRRRPEAQRLLISLLLAGYGAGKTYSACYKMIALAIENYPHPGIHVAPTHEMGRDILLVAYEQIFEELGVKYNVWYSPKAVEAWFQLGGDTIRIYIQIKSGEKPKRLKGPNLAFAGMDEPFQMDVEAFNQIVTRIRHPKARTLQLVMSGTPEGMGWGHDVFAENWTHISTHTYYNPDIGEEVEYAEYEGKLPAPKGMEDVVTPDFYVVQADSAMNVHTGAQYIGALHATNTELSIQAFRFGRFTNLTSGRCYYAYDPVRNDATDECELDYDYPVDISCDFNVGEKPMSWNISQTRNDRVYIRAALQMRDGNTPMMHDYVMDWLRSYAIKRYGYERLPSLINFYVDYSGGHRATNSDKSDIQIIEEKSRHMLISSREPGYVNVPPVKRRVVKRVRFRVASVNLMLYNALGEVRLFLHTEDCDPLKKDFLRTVWDKSGMREEQEKDKERSHAAAALGYLINYEYPAKESVIARKV